jgi:hypothetical protein
MANEDTRPLLQFKGEGVWHDVHSPSGTYGSYGSLTAYKAFLESRGRETRVIQAPVKRCPHCSQALPNQED